jgi:hypothetical protein
LVRAVHHCIVKRINDFSVGVIVVPNKV